MKLFLRCIEVGTAGEILACSSKTHRDVSCCFLTSYFIAFRGNAVGPWGGSLFRVVLLFESHSFTMEGLESFFTEVMGNMMRAEAPVLVGGSARVCATPDPAAGLEWCACWCLT